jgi:hypothetical protein
MQLVGMAGCKELHTLDNFRAQGSETHPTWVVRSQKVFPIILLDPNGLDVRELADSVDAEFASVA